MRVSVSVIFGQGRTYHFDVVPSITVMELKKQLAEEMENQKVSEMWLVLDNEQLYDESTLEDYEIQSGTLLKLFDVSNITRNIGGLLGVRFINANDDQALQRNAWSTKAPRWRRARPGMCVEGKCDNKGCDACEHMVVIPLGYKNFDLIRDRTEEITKCPLCKQFVEITTCAFNNCFWRFTGTQEVARRPPIKLSKDWTKADDAYHRFNENNGEIVSWSQLQFQVVKSLPAGTQTPGLQDTLDVTTDNDSTATPSFRPPAGQS